MRPRKEADGRTGAVATTLQDLGLHPLLTQAIGAKGRKGLPRVQALAVPPALQGRDVLAVARPDADTIGAFVLALVNRLLVSPSEGPPVPGAPRAVLLAPTKEVGETVVTEARRYGASLVRRRAVLDPSDAAAVGDQDFELLIATPSGLLAMMHQGWLELHAVELIALCSFDQMLVPERMSAVGRIIHYLPTQRQMLLSHLGLPGYAQDLAAQLLRDPVRVRAVELEGARAAVEQGVVFVANEHKPQVMRALLEQAPGARALVFTRTRHAALTVARSVNAAGDPAEAVHEGVSGASREATFARFREGGLRVLAATDSALRDVELGPATHVMSYDVPSDVGDYVGRIGRLCSESGPGIAILLCTEAERSALSRIERQVGEPIAELDGSLKRQPQRPVQRR